MLPAIPNRSSPFWEALKDLDGFRSMLPYGRLAALRSLAILEIAIDFKLVPAVQSIVDRVQSAYAG